MNLDCEKCLADYMASTGYSRAAVFALREMTKRAWSLWDVPDNVWQMLKQVCLDCPMCNRHVTAEPGDEWCFMCRHRLAEVENHVGPPVETGYAVGDCVELRGGFGGGRITHIRPDGTVEYTSAGYTFHVEPEEIQPPEKRTL